MKLHTHKEVPEGILCGVKASRTAATDAGVTCPRCLKMMALAARARKQQRIPPERWP